MQNSIEAPVIESTSANPPANTPETTPMGYNYNGNGPLINQFFAVFRNAGFRVGITIRPTQIAFTGDSAPSDSSTSVANAPVQSNPEFPPTALEVSILEAKIQYAYNTWGCTIFYLDSNSGFDRRCTGSGTA